MAQKQKPLAKGTKPKKAQTATKAKKPQKAKQPDKKPHWKCHICGKHRDLEKCKECTCGHPKCGQCTRYTQNKPNGDREVAADAGGEAVPRVLEQQKEMKMKEDVAVVVVPKVGGVKGGLKDKVKGDQVVVVSERFGA